MRNFLKFSRLAVTMIVAGVLGAALLAACAPEASAPTPTATAVPPTATTAPPTATSVPPTAAPPAADAAANCDNTVGIDVPAQCATVPVTRRLEGAYNFRELTTPPGQAMIRKGVLYRSDALHNLTDQDVAFIEKQNVRTIVDLRSHEEIEEDPNRPIDAVPNHLNLPIGSDPNDTANLLPPEEVARIRELYFAGDFHAIDAMLADKNLDIAQIRRDRYAEFATAFTPQIKEFMHLLTDADNFPMVFHCYGGKDRTGYVSAVVMLTLGYSRDDAMRDYLTTNLYDEELTTRIANSPASLLPIHGAHEDQLNAALDTINAEYGSFDDYIRNELELTDEDVAAIRENLLAQ